MTLRHLTAATVFFVASIAARADSLIGSTVDVKYEYLDTSSVHTDSGSLTVTPGLEVVSSGNANLTFTSGTQITVTNPGLGYFTPGDFNGFEVDVLSGATLDSVAIDPSSNPAFAGATATISGNDLFINLQGTCASCGSGNQNLVLDIVSTNLSSVTPEPSSFALLGTGLIGVAGVMKRRFA